MARGKRYLTEQVVNLLRGNAERQDDGVGLQRSGDRGADVLPLAKEYGGLQVQSG